MAASNRSPKSWALTPGFAARQIAHSFVHLYDESPMIGAVDIGGTKIAVGIVDDAGKVLSRTQTPTDPNDYQAGLDFMASTLRDMRREAGLAANWNRDRFHRSRRSHARRIRRRRFPSRMAR